MKVNKDRYLKSFWSFFNWFWPTFVQADGLGRVCFNSQSVWWKSPWGPQEMPTWSFSWGPLGSPWSAWATNWGFLTHGSPLPWVLAYWKLSNITWQSPEPGTRVTHRWKQVQEEGPTANGPRIGAPLPWPCHSRHTGPASMWATEVSITL